MRLTCINPGDKKFAASSQNRTVYICSQIVCDSEITFGEKLFINITLPGDAEGKLIIYCGTDSFDEVDNPIYEEITSSDVKDGFAGVSISDLPKDMCLKAVFEGNYAGVDDLYVEPHVYP